MPLHVYLPPKSFAQFKSCLEAHFRPVGGGAAGGGWWEGGGGGRQTTVCKPVITSPHLALPFLIHPLRAVTFCFCVRSVNDKMCSLFVYVWFGVVSVFSISCLGRSSLIPCTLLFCLLKHGSHCCSHRGKASADLFCLYCRRHRARERERERERAGKQKRLR